MVAPNYILISNTWKISISSQQSQHLLFLTIWYIGEAFSYFSSPIVCFSGRISMFSRCYPVDCGHLWTCENSILQKRNFRYQSIITPGLPFPLLWNWKCLFLGILCRSSSCLLIMPCDYSRTQRAGFCPPVNISCLCLVGPTGGI